MCKANCLTPLAAVAIAAGTLGLSPGALADGATNDTLACYQWSAFPEERFNLGIRNGGPLSGAADPGPAQRTHGIHGKHVGSCGAGSNSALFGVVTVAAGAGAHMGLYSALSRGGERSGSDDHCRPVSIDCYTEEANRAPSRWKCQSRNEFDVYHGESTLDLVALDTAPDDPLCAVFEDEHTFEDSNEHEPDVASGTRAAD